MPNSSSCKAEAAERSEKLSTAALDIWEINDLTAFVGCRREPMFRTTDDPKDGHPAWREYLVGKARFYICNPVQKRSEPEIPWALFDMQVQQSLRDEEGGLAADLLRAEQEAEVEAFCAISEELYTTRCLFDDELSRQIFDETICLRIARHQHFIGPRVHFDRVMRTLESKPFLSPDLPTMYSGIPLVDMVVRLSLGQRAFDLNLIAPEHFDDWFNMYRQYFQIRNDMRVLPAANDIVLDCGACIGEFSTLFAGFAGPEGRVYAFDPIPLHGRFINLQQARNAGRIAPIDVTAAAVGDENITQRPGDVEDSPDISPGGLNSSRFDMVRLDDFVTERGIDRVDYIKMDIESSEPDALRGAANVIRRFEPKLAISTYHTWEQFWSIPVQIKQLCPEYRLFLGHHSPLRWETVVYCCRSTGGQRRGFFEKLFKG